MCSLAVLIQDMVFFISRHPHRKASFPDREGLFWDVSAKAGYRAVQKFKKLIITYY